MSIPCKVAMGLALAGSFFSVARAALIPPDDPRIGYSDYIHMEFVDAPIGRVARFDRILDMPGKGYRWDNPGARIRFRTDAASFSAWVYYNEKHTSKSARNSIGYVLIDGTAGPSFQTRSQATERAPESVEVHLFPPSAGFHAYEVILPYGDSVDFQGLDVPPEASFEQPSPPPVVRYLAFGDSITHGFAASDILGTYGFLVARKKEWQLLNLGLGGRSSNSVDAAVLVSLHPDVVTVLMGVNDWQGGIPVDIYRRNMDGFLTALRSAQSGTLIVVITPLWVQESWKPDKAIAPLEAYRQALRDLVAARQDSRLLLIEGPELIDHDAALFDRVAVHPNDRGFAQMAERLCALLPSPP